MGNFRKWFICRVSDYAKSDKKMVLRSKIMRQGWWTYRHKLIQNLFRINMKIKINHKLRLCTLFFGLPAVDLPSAVALRSIKYSKWNEHYSNNETEILPRTIDKNK